MRPVRSTMPRWGSPACRGGTSAEEEPDHQARPVDDAVLGSPLAGAPTCADPPG